jgi:hypothetical protein
MILGALNDAGGQQYFVEQASKNPVAFMTLIGKILPLQLTGADEGPIEFAAVLTAALERHRAAIEAPVIEGEALDVETGQLPIIAPRHLSK